MNSLLFEYFFDILCNCFHIICKNIKEFSKAKKRVSITIIFFKTLWQFSHTIRQQEKIGMNETDEMCTKCAKIFWQFSRRFSSLFQKLIWHTYHLFALQEICQRPKFIAEGASRFDVEQGEQGDPWLLAAVSSLTLTPKFLDRVVPPDQNFEHGYCGVFR